MSRITGYYSTLIHLWNQHRATFATKILFYSHQNLVSSTRGKLVLGTATLIRKPSVVPLGNTFHIETTGTAGIGIKFPHQGLPFFTMRADISESVDHIHNIVCHFVWYGGIEVLAKIPGEQIGIVTNNALTISNSVHPSSFPRQVKINCDHWEFRIENFLRSKNIVLRSACHQYFCCTSNGLDLFRPGHKICHPNIPVVLLLIEIDNTGVAPAHLLMQQATQGNIHEPRR